MRDWSLLPVRLDDLIGNLRRSAEPETTRDAAKSGRRLNHGDWSITPQTVSASYDQTRNEITFPTALLQPPVFDVNAHDAVNYGTMGALVACSPPPGSPWSWVFKTGWARCCETFRGFRSGVELGVVGWARRGRLLHR
jgi:hypothetical protein